MPNYDFYCRECTRVEEEFFKIADEKIVECAECGNRMEQVILKAPGLSDPGGTGQKWTNDGYQMRDPKDGNLRTVKEKWVGGKNVIRSNVHDSDPNPSNENLTKKLQRFGESGAVYGKDNKDIFKGKNPLDNKKKILKPSKN